MSMLIHASCHLFWRFRVQDVWRYPLTIFMWCNDWTTFGQHFENIRNTMDSSCSGCFYQPFTSFLKSWNGIFFPSNWRLGALLTWCINSRNKCETHSVWQCFYVSQFIPSHVHIWRWIRQSWWSFIASYWLTIFNWVCVEWEHKRTFVPLVSSPLTLAFVKAWKLVAVLGKKVSTYVNNGIINHALLQRYVNTNEKGSAFWPLSCPKVPCLCQGFTNWSRLDLLVGQGSTHIQSNVMIILIFDIL